MLKNKNYLFYSDYFKKRDIKNKSILIAKTKKSYLIGPLINSEFDEKSFYKRIKSNSIYTFNIYKKIFRRKCNILVDRYINDLENNQVIEIYKSGEKVTHSIIKVPGESDEKK